VTAHRAVDLPLGRDVDELERARVSLLRHADVRRDDVLDSIALAKSADELGSDLSKSAGNEDLIQDASDLSEPVYVT
jgi:hypothetical protein